MKKFNTYIENLTSEFSNSDSYTLINNISKRINWPKGYGVYTLWNKSISYENLIYVGLTGKYKRNKFGVIELNSGSFGKRSIRYTPYRFCNSPKDDDAYRYSFRYGPKYSKGKLQNNHKYDKNAYRHTILYSDLLIVTFNVDTMKAYTPALLESLILTNYFIEEGKLPPANNEL